MSIDPRFIIELKGRQYALYQGVLDAATKAGLRSMKTTIVQIPSPENGHMAVVTVQADFEDGRSFLAVGDASPANCSPHIAAAALRMAETRGGGRALRVAINCGMTLLEELPDEERRENGHDVSGQRGAVPVQPAVAGPVANGVRGGASAGRSAGAKARPPAGPAPGTAAAPPRCSVEGCDRFLTPKQRDESLTRFGAVYCKLHQESHEATA
jgi:hypothetical protein